LNTLPRSGELIDTLKELGILTSRGKEFLYHRVVFPIFNKDGQAVGIYGRSIDDYAAVPHLYLPGPHQGVFNWQAAKRSRDLILTEGIIDALSLYQAGFKDVISLYGVKGLTPYHLALFKKYRTKKIFLVLDNHAAGEEACLPIAEVLSPVECFKVVLPVRDANEFFRDHSPDEFTTLCTQAFPVIVAKASEQMTKEPFDDGFSLAFESVTYRVKLIPTFDERLKVNIKVHCGDSTFLDTLDLYSHRSRQAAITQIAKRGSLGKERVEAHFLVILDEAERCAAASRRLEHAAPPVHEMSDDEREEALRFLRSPGLMEEILHDMEMQGYVGEDSNKLLAYLIGISRKLDTPLSGIISSSF